MVHSWAQLSKALARVFWKGAGEHSDEMSQSTDTAMMVEVVRRGERGQSIGC